MKKVISIGIQGFSDLREQDCFFVDKTNFIKEWWENRDVVTLITRPRRFGKTLNMSMLDCFFSNKYANRADLFEGLSIWQNETYRKLQGTYPVIFLSFAAVKAGNLEDAKTQIKQEIARLYWENRNLMKEDIFGEDERELYYRTTVKMDDVTAQDSLRNLSVWMERYYGKNVIILLDEYDTPMQKTHRTVRQTQHQSPTKPPGLCLFFCFAQFRISFESFLLAPQAPCYRQLKKWRSPFSLEAPVRFFPQFLLNLRKSGFFSFLFFSHKVTISAFFVTYLTHREE